MKTVSLLADSSLQVESHKAAHMTKFIVMGNKTTALDHTQYVNLGLALIRDLTLKARSISVNFENIGKIVLSPLDAGILAHALLDS